MHRLTWCIGLQWSSMIVLSVYASVDCSWTRFVNCSTSNVSPPASVHYCIEVCPTASSSSSSCPLASPSGIVCNQQWPEHFACAYNASLARRQCAPGPVLLCGRESSPDLMSTEPYTYEDDWQTANLCWEANRARRNCLSSASTCSNHGVCQGQQQQCICTVGHSGTACEHPDCWRTENDYRQQGAECSGSGVCGPLGCVCFGGFSGRFCEAGTLHRGGSGNIPVVFLIIIIFIVVCLVCSVIVHVTGAIQYFRRHSKHGKEDDF
jgi:hypothetical protein